jgi:hypothetical protein
MDALVTSAHYDGRGEAGRLAVGFYTSLSAGNLRPEWRGYDFILVRGKYIILRPHTHEIVYIIEG